MKKAPDSKMGLISRGTQIPPTSRRLKFGPFSKDLCYAIGGRMIKSTVLTDYRKISQKSKVDLADFRKMDISYQYGKARSFQLAHNRLSAAFGAARSLMWTTSRIGGLKTEINSIERRTSKLTKMP